MLSVDTSKLLKKRYLHIILPLFFASVIAYLDRVAIAYAGLTMNQDLGFTAEIFGMGAGIFYIGYILFEIPGAVIAEKWNPKGWLMRIMISWGIITFLMAFITKPWHFYLLRFLLGSAEASFYPVLYASIIPRWFTHDERPTAIALMLTSLQTSAIIGSPLAGCILDISLFGLKGWQLLYILVAIPALIFGFLLYFLLSNTPDSVSWLTYDEKVFLKDSLTKERISTSHNFTLWQALKNKEVIKLSFIYFLWITGFWGFNYWMPTVIKEISGLSNIAIGFLYTLPMIASLLVMIWIGHSSSRHNEKRLHGALPLFIASIGLGAGIFVKDTTIAMIFVTLSAIGIYGPFGVWWSYPTTFLSGIAAAGAIGLINSSGNLGGYLGPFIIGILKDATGSFELSFVILACMVLLSGLIILTLKEKKTA